MICDIVIFKQIHFLPRGLPPILPVNRGWNYLQSKKRNDFSLKMYIYYNLSQPTYIISISKIQCSFFVITPDSPEIVEILESFLASERTLTMLQNE